MFTLRPYQQASMDMIREKFREGNKRVLLVAPTGSGKTATATHMITSAIEKGRDVLFIAHRREILFQTNVKLRDAGLSPAWIMSGMLKSTHAKVHLASIQTLIKRTLPNVGLVIFDEAHHCIAKSYKKVIDHYAGVPQIGLTATPCRADGNGMGGIFDALVQAAYPSDLVNDGYLVPSRIYSPSPPDLQAVKIKRGDYDEKQLGEAMDKPKLVGDIVGTWERHAQNAKTIVFAVTRGHAQHLQEAFNNSGHDAMYVDGETPHIVRKEIFNRFTAMHGGILVNVGVATEGYDNPAVSCIVLARPTRSIGLYLQMAGRGLRPFGEKEYMLILDHSGSARAHGFPEEDRDWSMDDTKPSFSIKKKGEKKDAQPWLCEQCFYLNPVGEEFCGSCGCKARPTAKSPAVKDGELLELGRKVGRLKKLNQEDKEKEWLACLFKAANRGMKIGAAAHMYRKTFGIWPSHKFRYVPRGKAEWGMLARSFVDRKVS